MQMLPQQAGLYQMASNSLGRGAVKGLQQIVGAPPPRRNAQRSIRPLRLQRIRLGHARPHAHDPLGCLRASRGGRTRRSIIQHTATIVKHQPLALRVRRHACNLRIGPPQAIKSTCAASSSRRADLPASIRPLPAPVARLTGAALADAVTGALEGALEDSAVSACTTWAQLKKIKSSNIGMKAP